MLTPEQIADGWKPHDGGQPVGEQCEVIVLWRTLGPDYPSYGPACCFDWSEIIAYKEQPHVT